jgi:ABC-type amino acid transport substrate-binding protein
VRCKGFLKAGVWEDGLPNIAPERTAGSHSLGAAAAVLAGCAAVPGDARSAAVRQELAPTGKMRVAISVGPTANTFRATLDPVTKRPRGVAVDLAAALGEKLGAQMELFEAAKATGVVRRALDDGGFKDAAAAPAGSGR